MDRPDESQAQNSDTTPAGLRAGWARLMARPATRWATYSTLAVGATLALWGLILLVQPSPEPLDGFIARWNAAVAAGDDAVYDALLDQDLINANAGAWNNGLELLRDMHGQGRVVEPFEADAPADAVTTPARALYVEGTDEAQLTVDWGEREAAFHLRRDGWGRKWLVTDIVTTGAAVADAEPLPIEPAHEMQVSANVPGASDTGGRVSSVSLDETPPLDTEFKLRQILEAWRGAWEEKDIDAYMAWYADYATILRVTVVDSHEIPETLTKAQLKERMKRLVNRYSRVKVDVSNVRIRGSYAEADMRFQQDFAAWRKGGDGGPAYQDKGIKTLKFVNDAGDWRIYEESWKTYVDVPSYPLN
jgi:hypothetical protein